MRYKRAIGLLSSLSLFVTLHPPSTAAAQALETCGALAAGTVACIGVDHFDPANQQFDPATGNIPPGAKIFEYTDFFTRSLKVHTGDVVDFQVAIPDHLIQVVPGRPGGDQQVETTGEESQPSAEAAARTAFPLFNPDEVTAAEPVALGSQGPKIVLGRAVLANLSGGTQTCGASVATACDPGTQFSLTSYPNGPMSDWFVAFKANPGSTFDYFCHFHPGMRGTVKVVENSVPVQTQAEINRRANAQFLKDQAEGVAAYAKAQVPSFSGEEPGTRTYTVHVGVTTKDRHVAIHDMLPSSLNLAPGDRVRYDWQSNVIHTVSFTAGPGLISPFGIDCESSYAPLNAAPPPFPACPSGAPEFAEGPFPGFPELIANPGTQAPGKALTAAGADSGLLVGSDYGQFYGNLGKSSWSVKASEKGTFMYQCAIHDWMIGQLNVTGG